MSAPTISYQIANLLEKMTSSDKDFRYMATNDLMSELQKDSIKLDEDTERKVVKMLLKLLEDKNGEVQNLAVKCLGPLVNKVKDHQVEYIVDSLCNNMTSEKEQLRDVSSIGLKTVISELPPSSSALASNICKRITPRLTSAISTPLAGGKGGGSDHSPHVTDVTVQLEALDILSDLLLRFGGVLVSFHPSIQQALLPQLASQRLAVRKRAITALSNLVVTCSNVLFSKIMEYLIEELTQNSSLSTTRTYVSAVAAVTRSAGHRFGCYLDQIMPLLIKFMETDDDELREFCVQAFESFVVRCPKEVGQWVSSILSLVMKFLCYDPNYHYDDDEGDGMTDEGAMNGTHAMMEGIDYSGDEEEEQEYSDDEDMSWKVRRASAKCLRDILSTRRELLPDFYRHVSPSLIRRFKEREENVKADVFMAYIALLKHTKLVLPALGSSRDPEFAANVGISIEDESGVLVLLKEQIPLLIKAVTRQLKEKSIKTRSCCFNLLSELLHVMPGALSDHISYLIPGLAFSLQEKNSNSNMKIETLSFVNLALALHNPSVFHPHVATLVPLIVNMINDSFYKVVAESLLVIQELAKVLRPFQTPSSFDYTPHVTPMYNAVFEKLKATDIDQEVKEKAIACMGQLVASFGDYLSTQMGTCLPLLLDRLKNEITRQHTVKALIVIANSPLKIDLRPILVEMVPHLASFLRKNQRSLKFMTLILLQSLMEHYNDGFSQDLLHSALQEIGPLISDTDLQISQMAIGFITTVLKYQPVVVGEQLGQLLPPVLSLVQSPLLHGSSLQAAMDFISALMSAGLTSPTFNDLLSQLVTPVFNPPQPNAAAVHKVAYRNTAKCVAALCMHSPHESAGVVRQFITHLSDPKTTEGRSLFCLLSLGEIGRINPSALDNLDAQNIVLKAFASHKEDIQKAASHALGGIAVGNLEKFLPFVLNEIQTQPRRQYLLLISLKEIISAESADPRATEIIRPHITSIWQVLMAHAEGHEEGTRNIVAECLGKLCLLDPANLLPKLKGGLVNRSPLARSTAVTALKFTIVDQPQPIDHLLKSCIGEFLQSLSDEDLNVRRVALVTFNSAAHNKPSLIRDLLGDLLPNLYHETKVRRELIREVEMGPFKHTVDDGLDLRKAAFECMYTLLESCLERIDVFEFLTHVEDGLKDHYDIKMLTYLMVARLATLCPTQVLQRLERLVEPLKQICNAKVKTNSVKQEHEKQDELKRAAIRAFIALQRIPDAEKNPQLVDFYNLIKSTPELNSLFETVQKDPGARLISTSHSEMDTS